MELFPGRSTRKGAKRNRAGQKWEAKTGQNAWEVLRKVKIIDFGVGDCVGVSSIGVSPNGYNNKRTNLGRSRFVEAKRSSWSFRRGEMRPPRWGGTNNNIY